MLADKLIQGHPEIPHSYLKHLTVNHFIETISWWLKKGKAYNEQEVVSFYLDVMEMIKETKINYHYSS